MVGREELAVPAWVDLQVVVEAGPAVLLRVLKEQKEAVEEL